ncbi:MAG: glycosyltransferase family 2 protein [Spirochaetes bacterium]|nr:glycosyltransferase family 2 protein [Spirochaetota bacterium]
MREISVVIPVFNEEENVALLHEEVKSVCVKNRFRYEIIIIDDGSSDRTPQIIRKLSPVVLIQLRKNFGQTAAMDAGIKAAKYEYIVTMDGDRQNDPNDIPKLMDCMENNNLDIVSGWRKNRKDTFMKRFVSRGANVLRKVLIDDGIHDSGCSLKLYRKECFGNINLYGEMHRFIPAVLKIKGFKIGEVVVNHRARTAGKTKYNWKRTFKGFIDMVSVWFWNKFAVRPLHLLGGMGIFSISIGCISAAITVYYYITMGKVGHTAWPLFSVFFIMTGILLFVTGLMSDIIAKTYYETTRDSSYSIKQVVRNK